MKISHLVVEGGDYSIESEAHAQGDMELSSTRSKTGIPLRAGSLTLFKPGHVAHPESGHMFERCSSIEQGGVEMQENVSSVRASVWALWAYAALALILSSAVTLFISLFLDHIKTSSMIGTRPV